MNKKGFTLVELIPIGIVLVGLIGWTWNIIKIIGSDFDPITGMLVARIIGVFIAPVGAVLGFM